MAISKFTQPIAGFNIPSRPRIDLNIVSKSLDQLSAKQVAGEEARTKFQLLTQTLQKNVMPGEEGFASDLVKQHALSIDDMAENADLINSRARIASKAMGLTADFDPLMQNRAVYDDVVQRANKMYEDGDLTDANRYFAIEERIAKHTPGNKFVPGQLRKKIDITKYLKENLTGFRNSKNEKIIFSDDGNWINTVTEEGVPDQEVELAGRNLLNSDPAIRAQLTEEARFELLKVDPEYVSSQLKSRLEELDKQDAELGVQEAKLNPFIAGDKKIGEEDRKNKLANIGEERDSIAEEKSAIIDNPEAYVVGNSVRDRINSLIAPHILREGGTEFSQDIKAHPYTLAAYRASLKGDGNSNPYFPIGPERQVEVGSFDRDMTAAEDIATSRAMVAGLTEKIANSSGVEQEAFIQDRDFVMKELSQKEFLKNKILKSNGYTTEDYDSLIDIQPDRKDPDYALTEEEAVKLINTYSAMKRTGSAFPEWFKRLPKNEHDYLSAVADWKSRLSKEESKILDVVEKGIDSMPKSTASRTLALEPNDEREVLRQINGLDNVGKEVWYKGKQIINDDLIPEFKYLNNLDGFPINGKYHATVTGYDGKTYTIVFLDTRALSDFVAPRYPSVRIGNHAITDVPFAEDVMRIPEGEAVSIFSNGQNILGDGVFLSLSNGVYRMVDIDGEPVEDTFETQSQEDVIGAVQEYAYTSER